MIRYSADILRFSAAVDWLKRSGVHNISSVMAACAADLLWRTRSIEGEKTMYSRMDPDVLITERALILYLM